MTIEEEKEMVGEDLFHQFMYKYTNAMTGEIFLEKALEKNKQAVFTDFASFVEDFRKNNLVGSKLSHTISLNDFIDENNKIMEHKVLFAEKNCQLLFLGNGSILRRGDTRGVAISKEETFKLYKTMRDYFEKGE